MMLRALPVLVLVLGCLSAVPQQPPPVDSAQVERLVQGLGSADVADRERAERDLESIGHGAEVVLRKAVASGDAELRARARRLLDRIDWDKDPPIAFLTPEGNSVKVERLRITANERRVLVDSVPGKELWQLSWAPDGTRLAYVQNEAGVFMVGVDGGKAKLLTSRLPSSKRSFGWAPDGKSIVFVEEIASVPGGLVSEHLVRVTVDSKESVQLTQGDRNNFDPAWSPDGKKIAFVSDREARQDSWDIYVLDLSTGEVTRVSRDKLLKVDLRWSPRGGELSFSWANRDCGIGICYPSTKTLRRVTRAEDPDHSAAWSPDGTSLAFVRGGIGGGGTQIVRVGREGTGERVLVPGTGDKWQPTWSPDGDRVAFVWRRGGLSRLHVVTADGSRVVEVADAPKGLTGPIWSPWRYPGRKQP